MKRILALRTDRFGEFLLIIPALRALKETYPESKITLAVSFQVKELANLIDCVDEVLEWDTIKRRLRQYRFDSCILFNPLKEANIAAFLAGISVRCGYDRKWGFLLNRKIKDTKHLDNRHEVVCNLELVELLIRGQALGERPLGDRHLGSLPASRQSVPDFSLCIPDTDKYRDLAEAIAIHPFTSDPVKQWPVERFIELAKRITQEMNVRVVLVGKTAEGDTLQSRVSPSDRVINLINKTSLVELAQVLKQCKLLVTCDSGPMHLAAAVGTPVVALFRNDLAGKTAKRWGPWGEGHTVIERSSLEDISVEEVLEKVLYNNKA